MKRYLILCVVSALFALTTAHASEAFTMTQVIKGKEAYGDTCIRCHGINMVNSGTTVYDLRRFPKDDSQRFFSSVLNGYGNMPSFKGRVPDEDIQSIWAYVATRGGKDLE